MLYSQSERLNLLFFPDTPRLHTRSRLHCAALRDDISALARLSRQFPSRLLALRYEDGALDPLAYARRIYRFIGLDLTEDIENYVSFLTSTAPADGNTDFSIFRKNPLEASQKWRHSASFEGVSVVDSFCGDLYQEVGYQQMMTEEELKSNKTLFNREYHGSWMF